MFRWTESAVTERLGAQNMAGESATVAAHEDRWRMVLARAGRTGDRIRPGASECEVRCSGDIQHRINTGVAVATTRGYNQGVARRAATPL